MEVIKTILVRVVLVPMAGLLCSRTALALAHANDWYPERQLAALLMTTPSLLEIEWIEWGLLTLGTLLLWTAADYFFYRRSTGRRSVRKKKTNDAATEKKAPETHRSELEWNFEVHGPFIGLSLGPEQQLRVHDFQARGRNRTGDPLIRIHGYVRSDRTNKKYPTELNLLGTRASLDELNPIPVDAVIDTYTPFSPDRKPISMKEFLQNIVPFTFVFEYDGKQYKRAFTPEDIEPQIKRYEQQVRKSAVTHPKISLRDKSAQSEIAAAAAGQPTENQAAAYNAALKLPIIDEAIAILNHNAVFEQPIDDAGRFMDSIVPELKAGRRDDLISKLDELRARFVSNNQRIGALYVKTESIHEDISSILIQPYSTALYDGINELKAALSKIENPVPANVDYWIMPQIEKYKAGIGGVGAWRGTALFALFALRKKLTT